MTQTRTPNGTQNVLTIDLSVYKIIMFCFIDLLIFLSYINIKILMVMTYINVCVSVINCTLDKLAIILKSIHKCVS